MEGTHNYESRTLDGVKTLCNHSDYDNGLIIKQPDKKEQNERDFLWKYKQQAKAVQFAITDTEDSKTIPFGYV